MLVHCQLKSENRGIVTWLSLQILSYSQLQDKLAAVCSENNTPLLNCQQISSHRAKTGLMRCMLIQCLLSTRLNVKQRLFIGAGFITNCRSLEFATLCASIDSFTCSSLSVSVYIQWCGTLCILAAFCLFISWDKLLKLWRCWRITPWRFETFL